MKKEILFVLLTLGLGVSFPSVMFAEEEASMDPAMMEKMQTLMAPGKAHDVLKNLVGNWMYTGEFKMSLDTEPEQMEGSCENTLINGGRFLFQQFKGMWMGQEYLGTGYTGHDNIRNEYTSIWLDNMSTGFMIVTGSYDEATKTLSFSGSHSCPMTGQTHKKYRSEWKIIDENTNVYTSYSLDKEGTEYKEMVINYKR